MGAPPARVDILMSIPRVAFEEAWVRRVTASFDRVLATIISKQDLIVSNRIS